MTIVPIINIEFVPIPVAGKHTIPILWLIGPCDGLLESQLVVSFLVLEMEPWQSAAVRETFSLRREVKLAQIGTGKHSYGGPTQAQFGKESE